MTMMEHKDYWKQKLTPFDAELCLMIESLTGQECEPKNGVADQYFIVVDYRDHFDPDFVSAVMDAVAGRVGERLVDMNDDPDAKHFVAHIKFSESKYPGIIRLLRDAKQKPTAGRVYCHKLSEIRAVQVDRNNPDVLLDFVGNGEMEIPDVGPAVFHFRNAAGSVYAHAPEHSYIVYVAPERFEIVDKETFETEYELR